MTSTHRRLGLQGRLLVLVLIPALVIALLAGTTAAARQHDADVASDVHREVLGLVGLVDVRTAMMSARIPVEVDVRSRALGLDPEAVLALLDLDEQQFGDLRDVEQSLRALPARLRPFPIADVVELEQAVSQGASIEVIDRFTQLEALTDETWAAELAVVEDEVDSLDRPEYGQMLRDLDRSARATSAMASTITGLADFWFADMAGQQRVETARVQLGIADDRFDRLVRALTTSTEPAVATAANELMRLKGSGLFQEAIDDALAGRPSAPFAAGAGPGDVDLTLMVQTFTDSFELVSPALEVMDGRSAALDRAVTGYEQDASRVSILTLAGALAVVGVLLLLSLVVAASFERPLRRLIDGTRRIGSGDLDVDPLPTSGVPEIGEAAAALNDVVDNLRLLEDKLHALSDGDFDDHRLQRELPGELGQTLERSVEVLSTSIREQAELQAQLAHQATHDVLTGIPNRSGGLAALEGALARARRQGTTVGLAFLDLDGFKAANDTFGHAAGDEVLCVVADRLRRHARTGDSYARLGGDEFLVIAEDVGSIGDAMAFGRRIAAAVSEPVQADEHRIEIGVSIGLSLAPSGMASPSDLPAQADRAAYRAKRGRTGVERYDRALDGDRDEVLVLDDPADSADPHGPDRQVDPDEPEATESVSPPAGLRRR